MTSQLLLMADTALDSRPIIAAFGQGIAGLLHDDDWKWK